jgi:hypothetical protein
VPHTIKSERDRGIGGIRECAATTRELRVTVMTPGTSIREGGVRFFNSRILHTGAANEMSINVASVSSSRCWNSPPRASDNIVTGLWYVPRRPNVRRELDPINEHGRVTVGHFDFMHWTSSETPLLEQNARYATI